MAVILGNLTKVRGAKNTSPAHGDAYLRFTKRDSGSKRGTKLSIVVARRLVEDAGFEPNGRCDLYATADGTMIVIAPGEDKKLASPQRSRYVAVSADALAPEYDAILSCSARIPCSFLHDTDESGRDVMVLTVGDKVLTKRHRQLTLRDAVSADSPHDAELGAGNRAAG